MTVSVAGFTALIKRDGSWWIGWIAEVPGINGQEVTREQLLTSLKIALAEAFAMNRDDAMVSAGEGFEVVEIAP